MYSWRRRFTPLYSSLVTSSLVNCEQALIYSVRRIEPGLDSCEFVAKEKTKKPTRGVLVFNGARGGNRTRVTSLEGWGNKPLYDTRAFEENERIVEKYHCWSNFSRLPFF